MYSATNAEIMQTGMDCLVEKLGVIDAERFISNLLCERFNYTEWRQKYFANVDLETFLDEAAEFEKSHPFTGKAERI